MENCYGGFVVAEGLGFSLGDYRVRQLVLCWTAVWDLNPELARIALAECLQDWRRRAVPLLDHNLALQLRKNTEDPPNQDS